MPPLLVNAAKAARLLGIGRTLFLDMHKRGVLGPRAHRYGRRILWSVTELQAWVKAGSPSRRNWPRFG